MTVPSSSSPLGLVENDEISSVLRSLLGLLTATAVGQCRGATPVVFCLARVCGCARVRVRSGGPDSSVLALCSVLLPLLRDWNWSHARSHGTQSITGLK